MIPRKYPLRKSPIKKKPRKKSETLRIYGGKKRIEFVKSLPCAGCSSVGFSENAHIVSGGTGRKADYTKIVPLCCNDGHLRGCHQLLHDWGRAEFELNMGVNLDAEAVKTEKLWQLFIGAAAELEK